MNQLYLILCFLKLSFSEGGISSSALSWKGVYRRGFRPSMEPLFYHGNMLQHIHQGPSNFCLFFWASLSKFGSGVEIFIHHFSFLSPVLQIYLSCLSGVCSPRISTAVNSPALWSSFVSGKVFSSLKAKLSIKNTLTKWECLRGSKSSPPSRFKSLGASSSKSLRTTSCFSSSDSFLSDLWSRWVTGSNAWGSRTLI